MQFHKLRSLLVMFSLIWKISDMSKTSQRTMTTALRNMKTHVLED